MVEREKGEALGNTTGREGMGKLYFYQRVHVAPPLIKFRKEGCVKCNKIPTDL